MFRTTRSRGPLMEHNDNNTENTQLKRNVDNLPHAMKKSCAEAGPSNSFKRAKYPDASDIDLTRKSDISESTTNINNCIIQLKCISLDQWSAHERKIYNFCKDGDEQLQLTNLMDLHQDTSLLNKVKQNVFSENVFDINDKLSFAKVLESYLKGIGRKPINKSDFTLSPTQQFKAHIQDVLNKYNFDMKARMDLDYVPDCNNDIELCVSQHGKQANNYNKMADYLFSQMFSSYLKERNYQLIIDNLRECIIDHEMCPDVGVMLKLFELILNIEMLPEEDNRLVYTLQSLVDIFDLLFLEHPPHAHYMMRYYKNLLTRPLSKINNRSDARTKFDRDFGIFHFALKCLEEELKSTSPIGPLIEPEYVQEDDFFSSLDLDFLDDLCINNFKEPKKRKLHYLHEALDRKQRIHRLFTLLKIFVKLFENDLAFFTLIYGDDLETRVNKSTKPILAELLWPKPAGATGHKGGFMNPAIRRITELFLLTVKFQLSQIYIDVMANLFSLVVHSVNLHEPNSRRVFPYINVLTNCFATEVTNKLRAENPDTILNVLQVMKPAFMRSLVIDNLLNTITSVKVKSITSYYMLIKEEKYLQYKKHIPKNRVIDIDSFQTCDNYDNLIMLRNKITQMDFLQILYLAITSYVECYKINDLNSKLIHETIKYLDNPKEEFLSEGTDNKVMKISKSSEANRDLKIFAEEFNYNLRKRKRTPNCIKQKEAKNTNFIKLIDVMLNKNEIASVNQLKNDVEMSPETCCNYYRRCRVLKQFSKCCSKIIQAPQ